MKKLNISLIILILTLFICSCNKKDNKDEQKYETLTMTDAGEPYSDWNESTTGSAKYLDGSSIIVSIFLDDEKASWSEEDYQLVKDNMNVTNEYLVNEGKRYGKKVELIYDIDKYPDLAFHLKYNRPFPQNYFGDEDEKEDDFVEYVENYVKNEIPTEELMKKYGVNSIAYLIFIDNEADSAYAMPYIYNHKYSNYQEIAYINLRWHTYENVNPDTYAHEILHLFGAMDLYYTNSRYGITRNFIDYIVEKYSNDIMLGYATSAVSWNGSIEEKITNITAYFIGWRGYIYEIEKYPQIKQLYKASHCYDFKQPDDYQEYVLELDTLSETDINNKKYNDKMTLIGLGLFLLLVIAISKFWDYLNNN